MRDRGRSLGLGVLVAVVSPAVVVPLACTDAGGSVSGGDLTFEGGAPAVMSVVDAGPGAGTGTKWTDLYRDFFGPTGAAKCAGNGQCHGAADQPGAMASGGYICPDVTPPADAATNPAKAQCRDTMTKVIMVDPPFTGPSTCGQGFAKAYMHNVIRKATHAADDENNMPKSPFTFTFSDADVARIDTWVKAGCPDN